MQSVDTKSLPENAYTPLQPGETYHPVISASTTVPEVTFRSVFWGTLFCVIFTIASVYSGLKVGQVMEAAIPISILAIGLARIYPRRSTVLENVIMTGIGGVSGSVVAGAIFTLPALYILNLDPHPLQSTFICLAGGCLGVLFLIPLRRYFVRDTHGQFPYPEATAITEVLVTGEKGGSQAKLLLQATFLSGIYDFFVTTYHVWSEVINFRFIPVVDRVATRAKVVFQFDAVAFILGLGYVMGLRSSMILCAGGVLSNFVIVPMIWMIGRNSPDLVIAPGTVPIADMTADQIFRSYARFIGVGAIATAGIFAIVKSLRVVAGSFGVAMRAFRGGEAAQLERTDRDMSVMSILIGVVLSAIGAAILFATLGTSPAVVVVGLLVALFFSFFFTSVAALCIATTARNPVSGMTMLTIIVSSVVLLQFGLSGTTGMFFVMMIAGMVCTALSVSGQTITDLKTGYWLGSTPMRQERVKFLGVAASAVAAALTIAVLSRVYAFGELEEGDTRKLLDAPQAAIMKALVEGFMSHDPIPYILFGAGVMVTVLMEMLGVPALIFALGMYLPLYLNSPALVGGFLAHYLDRRANRVGGSRGRSIRERGIVIASGLMAGGALGGVFGAAMRLLPGYSESDIRTPFFPREEGGAMVGSEAISQVVSLVGFLFFVAYTWWAAQRVPKDS
ncbi:MAG TPA: oligopeptide transporter, OPT family [Candidatus Krumholzibacteria bacterium]|nr:oligopeptide transporter, OPT family [Candidatus Krumholzibacteria bacterium]